MKTDEQLQRDVFFALKQEPTVNATHIGVKAKNGVVTLAGHVDSYPEKWDAERVARRIGGIKALSVEMDVKLSVCSAKTDAGIARLAQGIQQCITYTSQNASWLACPLREPLALPA